MSWTHPEYRILIDGHDITDFIAGGDRLTVDAAAGTFTPNADRTRVTFSVTDQATHLLAAASAEFARAVGPPAAAPSGGDVLADIDAATEGRCACGCGKQITDKSPSAWFASATCQSRWNQQHVTRPGEVYDRADASIVWLDDSATWRPDLATTEPRPLQPLTGRVEEFLAVLSRYHATTGYDPASDQFVLRLDDGNRYVETSFDYGTLVDWMAAADTETINRAWQMLDRQLSDTRLVNQASEPDSHRGETARERYGWLLGQLSPVPVVTVSPQNAVRRLMAELRASDRLPQIDPPRPGCVRVLFIGGPLHCDLLATEPPLLDQLRVDGPIEDDAESSSLSLGERPFRLSRRRDVIYNRRRLVPSGYGVWSADHAIDVYMYEPDANPGRSWRRWTPGSATGSTASRRR